MAEKMIEYFVITEDDTTQLAKTVECLMQDGWQLQGGVAVRSTFTEAPRFYQAMIREKKESESEK